MAKFLDLTGLQTFWNHILAKMGTEIAAGMDNRFSHMQCTDAAIAGGSSATVNLKPDAGTYSVWLAIAGYNTTSGIYDYVGLVFIGPSNHVMDIAKGASSNFTITVASDGTATVSNGASTYARVSFIRVYRSAS